jgi:hypothetical protein
MISHKNWARQRNQPQKKSGPRRSLAERWRNRPPFRVFWADFRARFKENLKKTGWGIWSELRENFWSVYVGRTLRWTWKGSLWFLLILYLWVGALLTVNWTETKLARSVPVTDTAAIAQKFLDPPNKRDYDPEGFRLWLARRRASEVDAMMKPLVFYSPRMTGWTFALMSNWLVQQNRLKEGLFWREFALYRTHYDALRCGAELATERIEGLLHAVFPGQLQDMINDDPHLLPETLRKVLKFDEDHPALDNPRDFCKTLTSADLGGGSLEGRQMVQEKDWFTQYMNLRYMTRVSIHELEKQQGIAPPDKGDEKNGKPGKKTDKAGGGKKPHKKKQVETAKPGGQ